MTSKVDKAARAAAEADEVEFGQGRRVKVRTSGEPMSSLAVRLSGADIERLRTRADAESVGVTQLVRTWILARLDDDETVPPEAEAALGTIRRMLAAHP